MPPRRRRDSVPPAVGMAAGNSYCSELSLMVRQLGLCSQLDKVAHRQLRLVCRVLHADADMLIDTLTLRLDSAACSSPAAAQRVAAFHRRCTAAQTLHIYVPGGAYATSATVRCAEAYARAAGPLLAVQQCKVSGAGCGRYHVAMLRSLLGALPQLQGLSLMASYPGAQELQYVTPRSAAQLVSVLSDCVHLHSLALDYSPAREWPAGILTALPQLTQLRALSLTDRVPGVLLLPYLTRLTRLERLGVRALFTGGHDEGAPGVQLPSVRTLSAAWTDPLPPPPPQPAGSSSMSLDALGGAYLHLGALRALPNLTRVERMRMRLCQQDDLSAAHLPALAQRFAGCADMWRLEISHSHGLLDLKEKLLPGSLAALRHLQINCYSMSAHRWSALLQLLLAAAPNICSLGLCSVYFIPELANDHTLVQPLKHAAQLQTLLLDTGNTVDVPQLVAVVHHLAAPQPQEPHCDDEHCVALRCVLVRHWGDDGVVDAAAALLEESGCTIRLQRLS